ncbi:MAG: hypothetical protein RBR09_11910 [Desulfobulbaceae bacterium]|jgi:hypothetical protein|nr:hypothetical protein [Desulfobulbaceae bacterium]
MKEAILCVVIAIACTFPAALSAEDGLNACSVLTHAEAEEAAGVQLAEGRLTEYQAIFMQGVTLCHFESLDPMQYKNFVSVELTVGESREDAVKKFDDAVYLIFSPEDINALGDKAVWGGDVFQPKGGLHVLQDRYYLAVKVNRADGQDNLENSRMLTKIILERLQGRY